MVQQTFELTDYWYRGKGGPLNSKHPSLAKCISSPQKYSQYKGISASKHHKKCNATSLYMCIIQTVTDIFNKKQIQACFLLFIPLQRAPSL
jgi:hypothetical protein